MLVLYSLPFCAKCDFIKKKLTEKQIDFSVSENVDEMKSRNIKVVPVLENTDTGEILAMPQIIDFIERRNRNG